MASRMSLPACLPACRHCDACVAYCKDAIRNQPGVESYEISLKDQRVTVTGKVAPSRIARALKKDGRQVIVKGTGTMDAGNDGTEVRFRFAMPPWCQDHSGPT